MSVSLEFGALAPPLREQLKDAGLVIRYKRNLAHYQRDADAITRIVIRGLISDSQARTARKRLMRRIAAGITDA